MPKVMVEKEALEFDRKLYISRRVFEQSNYDTYLKAYRWF